MSKSRRVKISFSEESAQYSVIEGSIIATAQKKMSIAMESVVREYQKNEVLSKQHASKVVLNS